MRGITRERRQRRQRELERIKRLWAEDVDEFERRMVVAAFEGEAREHQAD